ncbi:unnamed protein product, partial [Didymodactylos carnosus]
AKKYNESCNKGIREIKFILNNRQDSDLLKMNEAIIDLTALSQQTFVGHDAIRTFILENSPKTSSLALYPFVQPSSELRTMGIKTFDWNDCIKLFQSSNFSHTMSIENNQKLI